MEEKSTIRVLVVDDEKAIRGFLRTSLTARGYVVFETAAGKEALAEAVRVHPDVVILDLGLPDIDGKEVIARLRRRTNIPIIILSVRDGIEEKIAALERGADDYLTKPFSSGELQARLKAVLRRLVPDAPDAILRTGALVMDITRRQVTVDGASVNLSPTEYDILRTLLENAGKVLTHKQLLRHIWDKSEDYEGSLHLLRVTMSNLRTKIETTPSRPFYIRTEAGIGYRLHAA